MPLLVLRGKCCILIFRSSDDMRLRKGELRISSSNIEIPFRLRLTAVPIIPPPPMQHCSPPFPPLPQGGGGWGGGPTFRRRYPRDEAISEERDSTWRHRKSAAQVAEFPRYRRKGGRIGPCDAYVRTICPSNYKIRTSRSGSQDWGVTARYRVNRESGENATPLPSDTVRRRKDTACWFDSTRTVENAQLSWVVPVCVQFPHPSRSAPPNSLCETCAQSPRIKFDQSSKPNSPDPSLKVDRHKAILFVILHFM